MSFWVYDIDRLSIETMKDNSYNGLDLTSSQSNEAEFWLSIGYMWMETVVVTNGETEGDNNE